jgi:hypothetical protein
MFIFTLFSNFSFAQSNIEPFPKLGVSADVAQEQIRFNKAKITWIMKYPDAYLQMMKENVLEVREELPINVETGTKADEERYALLKSIWIENNPQKYREMQTNAAKHQISKKEFETMPENKKAHILANPDKYNFID